MSKGKVHKYIVPVLPAHNLEFWEDKMLRIIWSSSIALKSPSLNSQWPTQTSGSHVSCRLWKTKVTRMWTNSLNEMLGSDHCGVCAKRNWNCQSSVSSLDPPPPWPARSKIQIWSFVSKWKDIFLTLKKWVDNVVGTLWHRVRETIKRLLLEMPGCVAIDTLYSPLPYYLTFSTLHSSVKGWQSQQLPPWVRTSPFKEP